MNTDWNVSLRAVEVVIFGLAELTLSAARPAMAADDVALTVTEHPPVAVLLFQGLISTIFPPHHGIPQIPQARTAAIPWQRSQPRLPLVKLFYSRHRKIQLVSGSRGRSLGDRGTPCLEAPPAGRLSGRVALSVKLTASDWNYLLGRTVQPTRRIARRRSGLNRSSRRGTSRMQRSVTVSARRAPKG
jgi:hypothetical protein